MEKNQKTNIILFSITIALLVLYIISLFVNNFSKDTRKSVKTALINSKYEKSISEFTLKKGENFLYLRKVDNLWLVSNKQDANYIPANSKLVQEFISDLIKVVKLYQISNTLPAQNKFGLTDDNTFAIMYGQNELFFGAYNFSNTFRYLMTGKNTKVYEIDTSLDKYLSTSIQVWSDPYIIAKSIKNLKPEDVQIIRGTTRNDYDVEKFLELRHGGTAISANNGGEIQSLLFECGDTSEITVKIYKSFNENEYNVNVKYDLENPVQKIDFTVKISSWTYNKIKEIML